MLCQVCEKKTFPILDLGKHPLCDDLIPINSKKVSSNYNIEIQYCDNCFTAFQKFNVEKTVLFPKTYHYRSRMTGDVLKGMKDLIDSLKFDKKNKITLLDIGSNDGSLLDIAAKKGTKIKSSGTGSVTMAEADLYYTGGTIIMDHGHGISTIYSHLETLRVKVGDEVLQGDIIGTVGSTGRSTGPHLDFRINWFQTRLDPMSVLN